jgi:DNA modification methylase
MNRIIHGDCTEVVKTIPAAGVFDDVQPWAYYGNGSHPTGKEMRVLKPAIQAFTQPGAVALTPSLVPTHIGRSSPGKALLYAIWDRA